jgi:glycosyltransferase involved in cell wall biosynthesis
VQDGWLEALVESLERAPDAGAAGPLLLNPNGFVQEAGMSVDAQGVLVSLGQDKTVSSISLETRSVDAVSAAALLLPREVFIQAGGFDLTYEPLYDEGADLCFRLKALGRKVLICPRAKAVHLEVARNDDPSANERRRAWTELNRGKFVARWGRHLRSSTREGLQAAVAPVAGEVVRDVHSTEGRPRIAVYTPFPLTIGGGERYILTLAWALSEKFAVTIVTPNPYSRLRLRTLGREFGIDLSQCGLMTLDQFRMEPRPDFMVALGNHVVPPIECLAPFGFYVCQFPFPLAQEEIVRSRALLSGWNKVLVYSEYSRTHVRKALARHQMPDIPIEILSPPVPQIDAPRTDKKNIVLSVGRFFEDAHSKRQDLIIEVFRALSAQTDVAIELHLAGASIPAHLGYLKRLQEMADGANVFFHINASAEELAQLYGDAAVYWHAAGLQADLATHPERAEHFGITVVEAMSAGCVPLAFNAGGPSEVIEDGLNGLLYNSVEELVRLSKDLFEPANAARRAALAEAARERAMAFAVDRFAERINMLVQTTMQPANI